MNTGKTGWIAYLLIKNDHVQCGSFIGGQFCALQHYFVDCQESQVEAIAKIKELQSDATLYGS